MEPVIAICPEPFGFGPASKALSVARTHEAERFVGVGSGLALEFLMQNGIRTLPACTPGQLAEFAAAEELKIVAAAAFLDFRWLSALSNELPTYFVDSLTFMWDSDLAARVPEINTCSYVVQDIFGAAQSARKLGISPICVNPIINLDRFRDHVEANCVISLGGLLAHDNFERALRYYELIRQIIKLITRAGSSILLTSGRAVTAIQNKFGDSTRVKSAKHSEAIVLYSAAEIVYCAPGLTTLLELSALQVPMIPLPPQNYSQCISLHEMGIVRSDLNPHPAWRILAEYFSPPRNLEECDGISWASNRMEEFSVCREVRSLYMSAIRETYTAKPPELGVSQFNGADRISAMLLDLL